MVTTKCASNFARSLNTAHHPRHWRTTSVQYGSPLTNVWIIGRLVVLTMPSPPKHKWSKAFASAWRWRPSDVPELSSHVGANINALDKVEFLVLTSFQADFASTVGVRSFVGRSKHVHALASGLSSIGLRVALSPVKLSSQRGRLHNVGG